MPTLTNYWFSEPDFRGTTQFLNVSHGAGSWAWINWSNIGTTDSTLVWEREDRELAIPLVPFVNTPDVLEVVDELLGDDANRTSAMKAGWIPWKYVPYYGDNPGKFGDLSLLVRLFFNFHVSTPWYCTDADGNISFYIAPLLDGAGHLNIDVDGWSYSFSGGGPFCDGSISDNLDSSVPGAVGTVQSIIDARVEAFEDSEFDLIIFYREMVARLVEEALT